MMDAALKNLKEKIQPIGPQTARGDDRSIEEEDEDDWELNQSKRESALKK